MNAMEQLKRNYKLPFLHLEMNVLVNGNIGKVIIDGYKVKAEVLNIVAHAENTNFLKELLSNSGFELPEKTKTD